MLSKSQFLQKKLLAILVIYLIFISIIPFPGLGTGLANIQNNIAWLVIGIFSILTFCFVTENKQFEVPKSWLIGFVGVLLLVAFSFLNVSEYISNGHGSIIAYVSIWIFLLALLQFDLLKQKKTILLYLLFVSIFVHTTWYFFYHTVAALLTNFKEGETLIDPAALGIFNQRNVFASMLATGLALSFYLYTVVEKSNNRILSFAHISFFIIGCFTLVFSSSRAGYLGFCLAIIMILPYAFRVNKSVKWWKNRLFKLLVVGSIGLLFGIFIKEIAGNVEKEYFTTGAREGIYYVTLQLIKESPLFGHGLGSFERVFLEQFAQSNVQGVLPENSWQHNVSHPHNELLLWGVEGGLVSLLLVVFSVGCLLKPLFRRELKFLAVLGLFLPIAFHSMVELPLHASVFHLIILVILFVYSYHEFSKDKVMKINLSLMPAPSLIIAAFLSAVFIINSYSLYNFVNYINNSVRKLNDLEKVYTHMGWKDYYLHVQYSEIAHLGNTTMPFMSQGYIEWANKQISVSPSFEYYQMLATCYFYQNDLAKVEEVLKDVEYYYATSGQANKWLVDVEQYLEKLK